MLQGVNILQCLVLALVDELRYHDTVTQLLRKCVVERCT